MKPITNVIRLSKLKWYYSVLLLVGLISAGCGRFDVDVAVERIETPGAVVVVTEPTNTPTPAPTQPQATVVEPPVATAMPTATAKETEATFDPYPVFATDVQAIRISNGTEMAFIYSGPGESFPLAGSVQSGLALAVNGVTEDGRWYALAGCGQQNPSRPAPSCWISTDPTIAEPISGGIVPSQQPVQPTDAKAVLIMAQDMALIHSGPDTTYPVMAQMAGGFSFNVVGISEDSNWWRLEECSSPLNEVLTECWISADSAITQALDEPIHHGPQSSAPPAADVPLRAGTITIVELPRCFNLDAGTVGSTSNANCEFNLHPSESAGTLIFEPVPPARFGFSGVFPEPPTEAMCAGSQHLRGVSEVIAPAASLYICYQTGEGRFGYLHFLEMLDSPLAVTLEWKTYSE